MSEFNLSKKEKIIGYDKLDNLLRIYPKKDVKEFIKKIGFIILAENLTNKQKLEKMLKLAGDKLNV